MLIIPFCLPLCSTLLTIFFCYTFVVSPHSPPSTCPPSIRRWTTRAFIILPLDSSVTHSNTSFRVPPTPHKCEMTLSRPQKKKKNPVQTVRPNKMSRPEKTRSSISCIETRTIISRNLCPRVSLPFVHPLESNDTFLL